MSKVAAVEEKWVNEFFELIEHWKEINSPRLTIIQTEDIEAFVQKINYFKKLRTKIVSKFDNDKFIKLLKARISKDPHSYYSDVIKFKDSDFMKASFGHHENDESLWTSNVPILPREYWPEMRTNAQHLIEALGVK